MAGGSGLTRGAIFLTQRSIDALRPAEAAYRVPDQRCIGLAVRVAPSGIKTWDLAYRIRGSGKTRRLSLGRISDVGLDKARERALLFKDTSFSNMRKASAKRWIR